MKLNINKSNLFNSSCNYPYITIVLLTFLATCGSDTQEKVMSDAAITSDGVMASFAPTATKSPHCNKRHRAVSNGTRQKRINDKINHP